MSDPEIKPEKKTYVPLTDEAVRETLIHDNLKMTVEMDELRSALAINKKHSNSAWDTIRARGQIRAHWDPNYRAVRHAIHSGIPIKMITTLTFAKELALSDPKTSLWEIFKILNEWGLTWKEEDARDAMKFDVENNREVRSAWTFNLNKAREEAVEEAGKQAADSVGKDEDGRMLKEIEELVAKKSKRTRKPKKSTKDTPTPG